MTQSLPFKVFLLTEADVEKIEAAPDDPHYHDYEELIIGVKGKLEHFIDFRSATLQAPFVSFVTKGNMQKNCLCRPET